MSPVWTATFYDGQTAKSQTIEITFEQEGIAFLDSGGESYFWPYKKLKVETLGDETRISFKKLPDATLVLSKEVERALTQQAPFLEAKKRNRRKFIGLIGGLTIAAGATATFLFVVVPSMAGYLARSTPIETERQIGENLASQIQLFFRPCKNDDAHKILAPAVQDLAAAAGVDYQVELTLVQTRMPNAFALPGGQMMATRGFLDAIGDDQEAFWAVIAHELAHVKNRDSMVALYRSLGLSTLLEIITGGSGMAQQAVLVGGQLTNLSYTRAQEQAADELAYEILKKVSLDPSALGRALSHLTKAIEADEDGHHHFVDEEAKEAGWTEWLQTHPDTEKRIERARAEKIESSGTLPLTDDEWDDVRFACEIIKPEAD